MGAWHVRQVNIDAIFENAIQKGIFSTIEAGDWMYMYTMGNIDYFKHRESRLYTSVLETA
jgi:hypothetical protein